MTRLSDQTLQQGRDCALEIVVAVQQVLAEHLHVEDCWPEVLARLGSAIAAQQVTYFQDTVTPVKELTLVAQAHWCQSSPAPVVEPVSGPPTLWHLTRSSLKQLQNGHPLVGPLAGPKICPQRGSRSPK